MPFVYRTTDILFQYIAIGFTERSYCEILVGNLSSLLDMTRTWVFLVGILMANCGTMECRFANREMMDSSADTNCPCSWEKIDDRCYFFSDKSANWTNSREDCFSRGGDLAVPISSRNNKHIYQVMKNRDIYQAWIGAHKVGKRFETVHGDNLSYENWYLGEPNNQGGSENCIEMLYKAKWDRKDHGGQWNDAECRSSYRYYICEMSV